MPAKTFKELATDLELTAKTAFEQSYDLLKNSHSLSYQDAIKFKLTLTKIAEISHSLLIEIGSLAEQSDWIG